MIWFDTVEFQLDKMIWYHGRINTEGLRVPTKIENFKSNFFLVHSVLIRLK